MITNPKDLLLKLNKNLQNLQQRAAKYGGSDQVPIELINQIDDYKQAMTFTEQVIAGELSELDWLEALQPLLVAGPGIDLMTVWVLTQIAFDQGVALGQDIGPEALGAGQEIFSLSLDRLRQTPKGKFIAGEFEQDPTTYEQPLEKELSEVIRADAAFVEQLKPLLAQFYEALKAHQAAGSTYQANLKGSGQIVQGKGAIGIQQGNQGQVIIGGSTGGDVLGPGATKTSNGGDE